MEHHAHCEHCSCGHEHEHHSNPVKRWVMSLLLISLILFLARPFMVQQMFVRASAYLYAFSYDEAIRVCEKIIMIDKKNNQAWASLGYALKENKELDRAVEAYKNAVELNPKDRRLKFDLAMVYFLKKDYPKAIPYFEALRKDGPDRIRGLELNVLNYHRSALFKLEVCYRQTDDKENSKLIKDEIRKYYSMSETPGSENK